MNRLRKIVGVICASLFIEPVLASRAHCKRCDLVFDQLHVHLEFFPSVREGFDVPSISASGGQFQAIDFVRLDATLQRQFPF